MQYLGITLKVENFRKNAYHIDWKNTDSLSVNDIVQLIILTV